MDVSLRPVTAWAGRPEPHLRLAAARGHGPLAASYASFTARTVRQSKDLCLVYARAMCHLPYLRPVTALDESLFGRLTPCFR